MILLVDGKEVKVLNDVKIIVPVVDPTDNEKNAELHLILTHEGIISDLVHENKMLTELENETYPDYIDRSFILSESQRQYYDDTF